MKNDLTATHWINSRTNDLWVIMNGHWHYQGQRPEGEYLWECCLRLDGHPESSCTRQCKPMENQ